MEGAAEEVTGVVEEDMEAVEIVTEKGICN